VQSVSEALATVLGRVVATPIERVGLAEALGRVLASDVVARRALPSFTCSAMDGYAARAGDLPATLPIVATVGAGDEAALGSAIGAVRIFTGAPLPSGYDTVVIQEDAQREGDRVTLPRAALGDNVRSVGEDVALGTRVLAAGTRLGARQLGLLAALGEATIAACARPRVALIATGDELVDVAREPAAGQLVDSSAHTLAALAAGCGAEVARLGIVRDEPDALATRLAAAIAAHDVVITTGGVSVGERDHVRDTLARIGVAIELYKVAMKPGKPFTFGTTHTNTLVFGLPGNPVSSIVSFELFVAPALRAMQRASVVELPRVQVRLADGYRKPSGRAHYLRAVVAREREQLVARVLSKQGSAMWSSLVAANALVEVAAEVSELAPGALATALLWEPV
jgi:molybdopterin molybdotransferase